MTATAPSPAGGQPAVRTRPGVRAAAGGVGGAVLVVATRVGLWLGVQLLVAGLLILAGQAATAGQALDEVAGWWMVGARGADRPGRHRPDPRVRHPQGVCGIGRPGHLGRGGGRGGGHFPDPMSASMADGWRSGVAKAFERQNAALAEAALAEAAGVRS